MIIYVTLCIREFAKKFDVPIPECYNYLKDYGGLGFLIEHYDIEHTLSIDDALDDMCAICAKNGGKL